MENRFTEVMSQRTNTELINVLTSKRTEYEPEALTAAETELAKRNLTIVKAANLIGIETIDQIYSNFHATYQHNPDFILEFYTQHSIFFYNVQVFKTEEDLKLYIELIWQYLNALYKKSRYNDTIDNADKFQAIIDNEIHRLKAIHLKNDWYYGILLLKAMAHNQLSDFKTATLLFKNLMQVDPKNDTYIKWFAYSQNGQRLWLVNTINIVCMLLIIIETFLKSYISNHYVRQTLLFVGTLGLMANWGYDYYIKRNFRKQKKE